MKSTNFNGKIVLHQSNSFTKKKVKLIELSKTLFNETGHSTRSITVHFDSQFKKKCYK